MLLLWRQRKTFIGLKLCCGTRNEKKNHFFTKWIYFLLFNYICWDELHVATFFHGSASVCSVLCTVQPYSCWVSPLESKPNSLCSWGVALYSLCFVVCACICSITRITAITFHPEFWLLPCEFSCLWPNANLCSLTFGRVSFNWRSLLPPSWHPPLHPSSKNTLFRLFDKEPRSVTCFYFCPLSGHFSDCQRNVVNSSEWTESWHIRWLKASSEAWTKAACSMDSLVSTNSMQPYCAAHTHMHLPPHTHRSLVLFKKHTLGWP